MAVRSLRLALVLGLVLGVVGWSLGSQPASAAASLRYLFGSGSQTGGKGITLRVSLTEPAPPGGAEVRLLDNSSAIDLPNWVTVEAGQTDLTFFPITNPVLVDTPVEITAAYGGEERSRILLVKAPVLTSIGVQKVIRHGGLGKVIVRLSGPAPAGGFAVSTSTSPSGNLLLDNPVVIPAGQSQLSLKVPASQIAEADYRMPDLPVSVTVSAGSASFTKFTTLRDFGDDPRPASGIRVTWGVLGSRTVETGSGRFLSVCVYNLSGIVATVSFTASDGGDLGGAFVPSVATAAQADTIDCSAQGAYLIRSVPGTVAVIATLNAPGYLPQTWVSPAITFVTTPTPTETAVPTSTATEAPPTVEPTEGPETSTPTVEPPTSTPTSVPPTSTPMDVTPTATPVVSPGCQELNNPDYDGIYQFVSIEKVFTPGDTLTFVGLPVGRDSDEFFVNDSSPFSTGVTTPPGVLTIVVPEGGIAVIAWGTIFDTQINWDISCTPAPG